MAATTVQPSNGGELQQAPLKGTVRNQAVRSDIRNVLAVGLLTVFLAVASSSSSLCFADEPAPIFAASLDDGQRISGTLPAELTVTTRFGEFRVPIDRLESIKQENDQLEFHLMNGDVLQGSVKAPFKLQAELGPAIELTTAGLHTVQRATSSLHTPWSEPSNHLRARLRLLEAPSGRRGEMTLLVELQNTSKETLRLRKPNLQTRVLALDEIGRQNGYNAWVTAQFEQEGLQHVHAMDRMALRTSNVAILPGGTYRLHITLPYNMDQQEQLEELEKRIEELEEHHEPARERTHFFGMKPLSAQTGIGRFRVFYHVPEGRAAGKAERQRAIAWSGSIVTPTLAIPFPERPR